MMTNKSTTNDLISVLSKILYLPDYVGFCHQMSCSEEQPVIWTRLTPLQQRPQLKVHV